LAKHGSFFSRVDRRTPQGPQSTIAFGRNPKIQEDDWFSGTELHIECSPDSAVIKVSGGGKEKEFPWPKE
jgi:hypothetical protein